MKNHRLYGAALAPLLLALAAGAAVAAEPAFTSIQKDEFAVAGSLSTGWADFDNDGDLDYAVSLNRGDVRLYRNDQGKLTNIGPSLGLPTQGVQVRALSWGDYDGDGWVDLLGGTNDTARPPTDRSFVWKNNGGKGFTQVAEQLGLTFPTRISRQSNWIDYDNDGKLDLYMSNRSGPNQLFRNDGTKFVPVMGEGGINDKRPTVGSCWFDYDRDGDLDLFLANQSGATDALWRNDKASFTDVAGTLKMDAAGRDTADGGVGCDVGDYDNDGNLDIFVATYGRHLLYRAKGDGTFEEVGVQAGVGHEGHAVAAAWGDYDNDGKLDLFVTNYHGEPGQQQPANMMYHNLGGGRFETVIDDKSQLNAGDHGVIWVDYNQDGAIDLTMTDGYGPVGGHPVFRNDLAGPARSRSLSIMVIDDTGRRVASGAEVRLYDAKGAILGARQVSTGIGYNAQSAMPVHFGLAAMAPVTVEVTYMGANGRRVKRIEKVDPAAYAGKSLRVTPQGAIAAR